MPMLRTLCDTLRGACAVALLAGAVPAAAHGHVWNASPPTSPDIRALATGNASIDAAIASACAREANPSAFLARAMGGLERSPMCFPDSMTREEWDFVLQRFGMLPPTMLNGADFFVDTSNAWQGNSAQGPATRALRASLTYSFPNDGVTWGLTAVSTTGPNTLGASLTTLFGAADLDEGREYFRQALASWRRHCGLTYSEVADGNVAMNQTLTSPGNGGGDIRIGGRGFGTGTFLAYNAFPSATFAGVGGGDMCFNTSFFVAANFNNPANNFRYMRNTAAHEHGHGTGNIHVTPCNNTKLMEPSIGTAAFDMMAIDDKRGGGRNYGDRRSGNQSPATATDFGDLTAPALRSVSELDLSTNTTTGFGNSDEDWFRFSLGSAQSVTITVDPTGGSYANGQQTSNCNPASPPTINADIAGNLNIELLDSAGAVVLQTASSSGAGANEVLNAGLLGAGTYTVRVFDVGPNTNQSVQLYNLLIRVGASTAPPQAIAGVHKRIGANLNCFFIGDIGSRVTETGATITGYQWDLNGDGTFETATAKANRQYVSNGVYPVSLRITDSNGVTATDTINVTVFGATTSLASVNPANGNQGTSQPVTLSGVNLKNLTNASMVTVSGTGVTVSGTPIPNAEGTQVTGLSFVITANAPPTARNVTVSNTDGNATLNMAFAVTEANPPCPGDTNGDLIINFADLNTVLAQFGQTAPGLAGDVNDDGTVNFADLNIVLANFGVVC